MEKKKTFFGSNLTGLADQGWLGRDHRHGTCESEILRLESIVEDHHASWPETRLVSEPSFELRP